MQPQSRTNALSAGGPSPKLQINQRNQCEGSSAPRAPDSPCDPSSIEKLEAIISPQISFLTRHPGLLIMNYYRPTRLQHIVLFIMHDFSGTDTTQNTNDSIYQEFI